MGNNSLFSRICGEKEASS